MQTRIKIGGTNYDSDKIIEATYIQSINAGSQFNVGTVASAQLTFRSSQQFSVGTTLTYYSRPHYNTGSYTQYGIFTIKDIQVAVQEKTNTKIYTYTCYDNVGKFDTIVDGWYNSISFSTSKTLQTLYSSLCSYLGLSSDSIAGINGAATILTKPFEVTNLNGKTMLGWIAQIVGGYAYAKVDGTIAMRRLLGTSAKSITYVDYTKKQIASFTVPHPNHIIVVKNSKGETYSTGSGSPTLKISGNPLCYDSQNTLPYINNLIGTTMISDYTPMTINLLEDKGINAGDRITVDGTATYVFQKKMDKNGVTFISSGQQAREEDTELQNDFVSYSYLEENKITVDTTNYGFIVNNGPEQSRLTPTQFLHIGPGSREASVTGYGLKWFDNSGHLIYSVGEYSGITGIIGFNTSGEIISFLPPNATDQWYQVRDENNASKWNGTTTPSSYSTPSTPPADIQKAVKGFVLELTNASGVTVYASTTFFAWPKGSASIEDSTTSAIQSVQASNGTYTAYCNFDFYNWKFKCWVNNSSYYARLRCFF